MPTRKHYLIPLITATYVLLLFVGSIYPFTSWQWPTHDNWLNSFENATRYVPRSDFIINYLIYVPLGILVSIQLRDRVNYHLLLIVSASIAAGFGLAMEMLQLFIPSRAHSFIDLIMNTSGAFTGALLHHLTKKHSTLGKHLRNMRYKWFLHGRYTELGLVTIALWALSEISPLAPALSYEIISQDYSHFMSTLLVSSQWDSFKIIAFAFEIFALFLITEFILINKATSLYVFGTFAGVIIYMKLPVADTQLTPEFFWGLIAGIALYFSTQAKSIELRTKLVMYALFLAYLINELNHPVQILADEFNWLPLIVMKKE
ncbi:MAG: VanZ family protein [Gammaproteobacteria bacterium]|nr:VanZ family protein [Gammaproteobacteria bacterium]